MNRGFDLLSMSTPKSGNGALASGQSRTITGIHSIKGRSPKDYAWVRNSPIKGVQKSIMVLNSQKMEKK